MTDDAALPHQGSTVIMIPARLAATRLPGKPLVDLNGRSMIEWVWSKAQAAGIGEVIVATADSEIAEIIEAAGGRAVMTDRDLPSGSDRVAAALRRVDQKRRFTTVINLQGDMPLIDPAMIVRCLGPLSDPAVDIATLVARVDDQAEKDDPNVVKAVIEFPRGQTVARARDFCRLLPPGHLGPHFHHIGIYAYRRTALESFVRLPQTGREVRQKLEQLRALDAGMRIDAALVDTVPIGVDTPADLAAVRALM